MTTTQSA